MAKTERIEYARYTKAHLEQMAATMARFALVGSIYYGNIGTQEVRWCDDGSVEVFTHHTPADLISSGGVTVPKNGETRA